MTETVTTPTGTAGDGTVRPGRLAVATTSDTAVSVWFYVIAILSPTRVFGVVLGTSLVAHRPEGPGLRFDTAEVSQWTDGNRTLGDAHSDIVAALAGFLVAAGLPDPTTSHSGETPAEAYHRGEIDGRMSAQREFEAWKARATETAHTYADNNSLCSEFDRCMEEIGLDPRIRSYRVDLDVSATASVYVDARNEEEAAELAEEMVSSDPRTYVDMTSLTLDVGDVERD